MTAVERLLQERRSDILQLATRHGARRVRIFGSIIRGTATENSDIDLLVAFEPDRSLLDRLQARPPRTPRPGDRCGL